MLLLIISISCFSQIDIEDEADYPKVDQIPFDGEFLKFGIAQYKKEKAGLVGEKVLLIDVNTHNIYANKADYQIHKPISYTLEDEFVDKTFTVVNYRDDNGDLLTIANDSNQYLWKVSASDEYVFNTFIDQLKSFYLGKVFVPLHDSSKFKSLDRSEIIIEGSKAYTITKIQLAKLGLEYKILGEINDSFECIIPLGKFERVKVYNGVTYVANDRYVYFQADDFLSPKILMIEEKEFVSFSERHQKFLPQIRAQKVAIGMSIEEVGLSWGSASSAVDNVGGYDQVRTYAGQSLYFKDGILKRIK